MLMIDGGESADGLKPEPLPPNSQNTKIESQVLVMSSLY